MSELAVTPLVQNEAVCPCGQTLPADAHPRTMYCSAYCRNKATRERHAERIRERKRQWRQANIERLRAKDAARTTEERRPAAQAHYQANRERILKQRRETRTRERELAKQRYAANPERKKAAVARWQKRNPLTVKAIGQRKRVRKLTAPSIPFTAEQLAQRLAYYGHRCWMCHGEATTIDHVKPLSRGGWHALCNIRPACASCNSRKKARWPYPLSA